jgi:glucosamine kinase
LVGGLAPAIEPWLSPATRRQLVAPEGDTVAGALQLARTAAESTLHQNRAARQPR